MKVLNALWKILVAIAAVAGIVYVAITYGDKISAWVKKMIGGCCCCGCDCDCACECEDAPAEEIAAEDTDFEN